MEGRIDEQAARKNVRTLLERFGYFFFLVPEPFRLLPASNRVHRVQLFVDETFHFCEQAIHIPGIFRENPEQLDCHAERVV